MISKTQSYFIDYPAQAKLWVFMAEHPLNDAEQEFVKHNMNRFIPQWQAHGNALKAGFEVIENQFLVVVVDENQASASGCSIDAMTRFVKEIEKELQLSFTNRMLVTYQENNSFKTVKLAEFKNKVKNGELTAKTIIYNNSVANLSDFWDNWEQPLSKSWAKGLMNR